MVAVVSRLGFDIGRWGIALGALSDPSFSEVDPFVVLLFGAEVKEVFVGFFFVVEGVYLHHRLACVKLGYGYGFGYNYWGGGRNTCFSQTSCSELQAF